MKWYDKIIRHNVWLVCIILILGLMAHASMLPSSFKNLDDNISILSNPAITDFANTPSVFTSSFFGGKHYYRPLVTLSFMANYHFAGLEPFYYNLTNLMFHLSIAVTVFFLVFLIVKDRTSAFFVALLFAVHPIHWEAVGNIPGRAVILSTFFTVNAFFFYCLAKEKGFFVPWYIVSLLLFAGGLLSKESAAMMPLLLCAYIFLMEKRDKNYLLTIPYFSVLLVYIVIRLSLGITQTFPWQSVPQFILGFVSFLRACCMFARLFIWPVDLHFDRAQAVFVTFRDPQLWATISVMILVVYLFLKSKKRFTGVTLFFMAWVVIELFPVSQIITTIGVRPGYISAAEHFLYSPSIGVFVLLVGGGQRLYHFSRERKYCSQSFVRLTLVCIIAALMITTARQGYITQNAFTMLRQSLTENPHNTRILFSMGLEMVDRKEFEKAEQYFRKALAGEPFHLSSRLALGRTLHDQGKYMKAIAIYETIKNAGRYDQQLRHNRNEAYQRAVEHYEQLIRRSPQDAQLYYSLGTIYSRSGHAQESLQEYQKAIALEPHHKNALFNLASTHEALGEFAKAIVYYEQMLALNEEKGYLDRHAYQHLGNIYLQQGERVKAQEYFKKAGLLDG